MNKHKKETKHKYHKINFSKLQKFLRISLFILVGLFIFGALSIITYNLAIDPIKKDENQTLIDSDKKNLVKDLQKMVKQEQEFNNLDDKKNTKIDSKIVPPKLEENQTLKTDNNKTINEIKNSKVLPNLPEQKGEDYKTNYIPPKDAIKQEDNKTKVLSKPKLAIIFDDVSFNSQIKAINNLKFISTPSFFPPTKRHPHTPKLAKTQKIYMVHLPMEALNYNAEEEQTLYITHTKEEIEKRLIEIKKDFPNLKYLNNHTGSKFTSNYKAMDNLIQVFLKHNLIFIDSRTTSKTEVNKVVEQYNIPYIARNVFLDHESGIKYIQNQLKKAVAYAKKHGKAIAIAHPRKTTIQALKDVDDILKDVDCVTIDKF